jgi:hypothetical protein
MIEDKDTCSKIDDVGTHGVNSVKIFGSPRLQYGNNLVGL